MFMVYHPFQWPFVSCMQLWDTYPTKTTWLAAIKNGIFVTWQSLMTKNVNKYHPETNETDKGHMKLQCTNVRSTKALKEQALPQETNSAPLPKKSDVYLFIFNAHDTMYTDQTGAFPVTSSRGNKYIMVLYEVDGNHIDAEPMKRRTGETLVQTYLILWKRPTSSTVITPNYTSSTTKHSKSCEKPSKSTAKCNWHHPIYTRAT